MFSRKNTLLKDNKITPHMIAYMYFCSLLYENNNACFPNFGAARTPYLMYDVYTNDSKHGLCFPTLKYLLHISIDMLYIGIVYRRHYFLQICKRVTALD